MFEFSMRLLIVYCIIFPVARFEYTKLNYSPFKQAMRLLICGVFLYGIVWLMTAPLLNNIHGLIAGAVTFQIGVWASNKCIFQWKLLGFLR